MAGEAVIGTKTADQFGIAIGDHVEVESSFYEPESVTIVGTAVLPSLGSFQADRTGLGTGIFIIPAVAPSQYNPYPVTMAGITVPNGSGGGFIESLGARVASWDIGSGQPLMTLDGAIRPPAIVNVSDMRTAPLVLGGVLALALVAGLALSTAVSVRERRRELAILRTLGCSGRTLYASVWWQVVSMVTVGLIGGIPLGVIAGKYAWSTFAGQLGVVPRADISIVVLVAVGAGSIVLGLVAAVLPARAAARVAPAEILQTVT